MSSGIAAEKLADPTRPLGWQHSAENPADTNLQLQSIVVSGQRKFAVINGKTVYEKDHFGNVAIQKITSGKVIVARDGKQQTLYLHRDIRQ